MTDITQPSSKLIDLAKTVSGTTVSHNTWIQDINFCNMCKLHRKTNFKFLWHISAHIRTHTLQKSIPNNRWQTGHWNAKRNKTLPEKIKSSLNCYITKLWESEALDCSTKFRIMARNQLKNCCLGFQIGMVKLSFVQKLIELQ